MESKGAVVPTESQYINFPESASQKVAEMKTELSQLKAAISNIVVGQDELIEHVLVALLSGGHLLLEGVPGLGKTLLVKTLAASLNLQFSRIQCTPDLMPSDIVGTNMLTENSNGKQFTFQPGPLFANIVLADEINRATPKTQSALLEAMQEGSVTVSKTTHFLPKPFFVLATQNPIEMEGTYPLPEAQLDRFFFHLLVKFPSRQAMHQILEQTTSTQEVHPQKSQMSLLEYRELVRSVPVSEAVRDFAIRLVEATHPYVEKSTSTAFALGPLLEKLKTPPKINIEEMKSLRNRIIRHGASPRAAQALLLAGKVFALLAGRFAVSTEDIQKAAIPVLRHRIILSFEGQAERVEKESFINALLLHTKEGGDLTSK